MKYLHTLANSLIAIAGLLVLANCSSAQIAQTESTAQKTTPPNAITGLVFRDLNSNGIRELREPGEPNILVTSYDAATAS